MNRMTVSLSGELLGALDALATARGESRSALVEVLLREHPLITGQVQAIRGIRSGRSLDKLLAVADQGKANLDRAQAEGRIRFHD